MTVRVRHGVLVAALGTAVLLAAAGAWAHAGVDELKRDIDAQVAARPGDPQLRLERARILQLAGEWEPALAELDAATERGANADEVGSTRAAVLLAAGRPQPALDELDVLLQRRPDAYGLLFERGRALLALGRPEDAAREFGRAIAGMPQPRPEQVIARRDALLALGRRAEAVAALDEGMARVGRVVSLQLPAIDLDVELGRYDSALRRLDELLAQAANPAWVARRGDVLARAGRIEEARAEYARALALIDTRPGARQVQSFAELRQRLQTALASSSR